MKKHDIPFILTTTIALLILAWLFIQSLELGEIGNGMKDVRGQVEDLQNEYSEIAEQVGNLETIIDSAADNTYYCMNQIEIMLDLWKNQIKFNEDQIKINSALIGSEESE